MRFPAVSSASGLVKPRAGPILRALDEARHDGGPSNLAGWIISPTTARNIFPFAIPSRPAEVGLELSSETTAFLLTTLSPKQSTGVTRSW